jgi:transcriptional regulator with XRE-family HTH domain
MFSIPFMRERDRARRERFRRYYNGPSVNGDSKAFLERTGYTKGRLSQLLDGNGGQPFGEKAAENLARKLGLRPDYFERDEADAPAIVVRIGAKPARDATPRELELLRLWEPLLPDQREALMLELQKQHTIALRAIAEVQRRGYASTAPEDALPPEFTRPAQRDLIPKEPVSAKSNKRPRGKS